MTDPPVFAPLEPDEGTKALILAAADNAYADACGVVPPAKPAQDPEEDWWTYFRRLLRLYFDAAAPIIVVGPPPGPP
jgi:hypothetical protein